MLLKGKLFDNVQFLQSEAVLSLPSFAIASEERRTAFSSSIPLILVHAAGMKNAQIFGRPGIETIVNHRRDRRCSAGEHSLSSTCRRKTLVARWLTGRDFVRPSSNLLWIIGSNSKSFGNGSGYRSGRCSSCWLPSLFCCLGFSRNRYYSV
jgi:hypothetical protein